MKSFALIAGAAFASKSDFPQDDAFHAKCHLTATYRGFSCESIWTLMENEIRQWN